MLTNNILAYELPKDLEKSSIGKIADNLEKAEEQDIGVVLKEDKNGDLKIGSKNYKLVGRFRFIGDFSGDKTKIWNYINFLNNKSYEIKTLGELKKILIGEKNLYFLKIRYDLKGLPFKTIVNSIGNLDFTRIWLSSSTDLKSYEYYLVGNKKMKYLIESVTENPEIIDLVKKRMKRSEEWEIFLKILESKIKKKDLW
ncbi:hypothetical protein BLD25_03475 [Candidatus Gracilibacteria bacterium GN02-872]|nr:hypothetical protein BLD25_03475 [Candidatus Gracilibacteria bacterium GN02-872]RKW23887.1 MAG: hypothetical protein D8B46_02500 [Candidatus Gracilibacteria bacterium]